ncbi:MAG: hypothetical protein JWO05_993 [Gemmatimonadetes bacterium]|nr:hypothetical protein [Gemmatimonadota bacterium]
MKRVMSGILALAAMVAVAQPMQAQAKPVVAVLNFDNNAIGAGHADFDGLGRGIADMLMTDLASSSSVKLVDRAQINKIMEEQGMTKSGAIDAATAVKLGKLIGAQYMITGGFMTDGKTRAVMTARAINVSTSEVVAPQRVNGSTGDVLGLIADLSAKVSSGMHLAPLSVGMNAPAPSQNVGAAQQSKAAPAERVATNKIAGKMDIRSALLYSKALEASDSGNNTKAVELYRQVLAKFPDYEPAQQNLRKVQGT